MPTLDDTSLGLQLPHFQNPLDVDVHRLRASLLLVDDLINSLDNAIAAANAALNAHALAVSAHTKAQVGLDKADNTADSEKSVAKAGVLATARNITIGAETKGFDGSESIAFTLPNIGAAPKNASLSDEAAASDLPSTATTPLVGLLQTMRNALKWLVSKFDTGGEVDIKWDIPTGSTNAIALTDRGRAVTITANTSIPTNASVAFPVGSSIMLIGDATGRVITGPAASSLTIDGVATAKTSFTMKANKSCIIRKTATDAWRVFGDVT